MEYYQPQQLKQVLRLLEKGGSKAKLIAGGTNVIPDLRSKAIKPAAFIDLSRLKSLSYIKEDEKKIHLGTLTTISDLVSSRVIKKYAPILSEAGEQLGNPLVRNRATIGGNLADASPAADTAVPLLVLDAEISTSRRKIPIHQFFIGPNKTVLKKGEIIKEIIFSKPNSHSRMGYLKLGLRNAMSISVVSIAVLVEMDEAFCKKIRIGLGAVAPTPLRAFKTERLLIGKEMNSELIEACGSEIKKEVNPITDIRASAEYRREMASVLLKRLLWQMVF